MTAPAALSHFGIHVTDLARMEEFYTRVLGLLVSDRGALPGGPTLVFLSRDPDEHHQLVLVTGRPADAGYNVVNQISFKLPTLGELKAAHARLKETGRKEFRIVTHGNAWSIYFPDPEGNRVELFVDSGWRSPAYQAHLLRQAVAEYGSEQEAARWVATPSTSAHVS